MKKRRGKVTTASKPFPMQLLYVCIYECILTALRGHINLSHSDCWGLIYQSYHQKKTLIFDHSAKSCSTAHGNYSMVVRLGHFLPGCIAMVTYAAHLTYSSRMHCLAVLCSFNFFSCWLQQCQSHFFLLLFTDLILQQRLT